MFLKLIMKNVKVNSTYSKHFTSVDSAELEEKIDEWLTEMYDDWEEDFEILSIHYSTCFVPPQTIVYSCLIISKYGFNEEP
jgi:hypothetical protein